MYCPRPYLLHIYKCGSEDRIINFLLGVSVVLIISVCECFTNIMWFIFPTLFWSEGREPSSIYKRETDTNKLEWRTNSRCLVCDRQKLATNKWQDFLLKPKFFSLIHCVISQIGLVSTLPALLLVCFSLYPASYFLIPVPVWNGLASSSSSSMPPLCSSFRCF